MEDAEMKKQIVTGLIGAAALVLAGAGVSFADCKKATVDAVGSGNGTDYKTRWVTVTCNDTATPVTGTYKFHSQTDPDGKAAIALTAQVEGKTVAYTLYTGVPADTYIVGFSLNNE
jgi:hypothetical protein